MRIRRLIHGSITMQSRPPAQRSRPRLPAPAGSAPLASCGPRGITRRNRAMGFCYFSNIAIAALAALDSGVERVVIWDFDAHHGNGTEDVVAHNPRLSFASIHQFPAYPGTGAQSFANIDNYPVAPNTPRAEHVNAIERALERLLLAKPGLLLVSAGFDAYSGDPLTEMTLGTEDFATLGKWLAEIDVPAAAILEGGYSDELPELIDAFLTSWSGD